MNKCVFGYCTSENKVKKDCKKCGENTKLQGYTGGVYATNNKNIESK